MNIRINRGAYDLEGRFVNDSLPNGEIKYYIKNTDSLASIRTFNSGIENGTYRNYFRNRLVETGQVINGQLSGFVMFYDSADGHLLERRYFLADRETGPLYEYDDKGAITHYSFLGFTGAELYYYSPTGDPAKYIYPSWQSLNTLVVRNAGTDGAPDLVAFYYDIKPPKIRAEGNIFYTDGKIFTDSVALPFTGEGYFFEQHLKSAPAGQFLEYRLTVYDSVENKFYILLQKMML